MLVQASQLRIINFQYCQLFNAEVLRQININCNPFSLRELYLDGCEAVSDTIFDCIQLSKEERELDSQLINFTMGKSDDQIDTQNFSSGIGSGSFDLNTLAQALNENRDVFLSYEQLSMIHGN